MFNIDRIYKSEDEAKEASAITIMEILSNQSYLEDEKFSKLFDEMRDVQNQIDSSIQSKISQQIDAINQTKQLMDSSQTTLERMEKVIFDLNAEYEKDHSFHKELVNYQTLFTYRKNLGLLLDQMKYIFSVQEQIDKMNKVFESGTENLDSLFYKLIALVDIRDNIVEAANSMQSKQDLQVIINEFKCLQDFEDKFYAKIFGQFEFTLDISIKSPQQLIKMLQIVETGDKVMAQKKKPPIFKERALRMICTGIDNKFEQRLKDAKDIAEMLERSKFTSQDLILAYDHTVKCFPKHYNIFKVFEQQYGANVEKRIMPVLVDEEQITKFFGILIMLLGWFDSYEDLIQRVGEQSEQYISLKCKVKSYMPAFQDHVSNLIIEYCDKAFEKDKMEQQTQAVIEGLIKQRKDLITFYPEDIFHFINQQLDLLGPKLRGELLIEFIRQVCSTLAEVFKKECRSILSDLPVSEQESSVSPLYLTILQINNYYRCMTHSNETKQYCLQFVHQSMAERVEQIIYQDLTTTFNESINSLLDHCVKIVFYEVNNLIVPFLFSPKWLNEDLINQALQTLKDYLQEAQLLMFNQIHYNKLVKLVFRRILVAYQEQLIYTFQFIQPGAAKDFFPKSLTNLSFVDEKEKDKKKKEKERREAISKILSNRDLVGPQMVHDRDQILKVAESDYMAQLGKTTIQGVEKSMSCLINTLTRPKNEIDSLIPQLIANYESNAAYLMEVVVWMREDLDQKTKSQKLEVIRQKKQP